VPARVALSAYAGLRAGANLHLRSAAQLRTCTFFSGTYASTTSFGHGRIFRSLFLWFTLPVRSAARTWPSDMCLACHAGAKRLKPARTIGPGVPGTGHACRQAACRRRACSPSCRARGP